MTVLGPSAGKEGAQLICSKVHFSLKFNKNEIKFLGKIATLAQPIHFKAWTLQRGVKVYKKFMLKLRQK